MRQRKEHDTKQTMPYKDLERKWTHINVTKCLPRKYKPNPNQTIPHNQVSYDHRSDPTELT